MTDEIDAGVRLGADGDRFGRVSKRVGEPIVGLVRELMRDEQLYQTIDSVERNEPKQTSARCFQYAVDSLDQNRQLEEPVHPPGPLRFAAYRGAYGRRHLVSSCCLQFAQTLRTTERDHPRPARIDQPRRAWAPQPTGR